MFISGSGQTYSLSSIQMRKNFKSFKKAYKSKLSGKGEFLVILQKHGDIHMLLDSLQSNPVLNQTSIQTLMVFGGVTSIQPFYHTTL